MPEAKYTSDELLREYVHTWSRHHGQLTLAAHILGYKPQSLERRFHRMRRKGYQVDFTIDSREPIA